MTDAEQPLRVSTIELFFDLVFVFTITQLTGMLARDLTPRGAARVLLVFGVLWWMYGAYAWLNNARTPRQVPERLLLLLGMAGWLVIGLAIPDAFGRRGAAVALGLGYLLVVAVHGALYLRANRNILRVVPFNVLSALLVIAAGLLRPADYALWAAALAVPALSPLLVKPQGRFSIQPAHFVERHGALVIVAFGESVADIGIGAAAGPITVSLVTSAVLGLALTAALWWAYFGVGDDERAEAAMTRADPARRPALALNAYFYSYIPLLLGIVTMAAGLKDSIGSLARAGSTLPYPVCLALGGGVALYLAGSVAFRLVLRVGTQRWRAAAAAAALAVSAVGVTFSVTAELALLTLTVAAALIAEQRRPLADRARRRPGAAPTGRGAGRPRQPHRSPAITQSPGRPGPDRQRDGEKPSNNEPGARLLPNGCDSALDRVNALSHSLGYTASCRAAHGIPRYDISGILPECRMAVSHCDHA